MRYTNELDLPKPLLDAVTKDTYDREDGVWSITTLLKPARIVALERQHKDELVEDASSRLWSLFGSLIHQFLENHGDKSASEKRYYATLGGQRISGKVDYYLDGVLTDWKFVTAYKFKNGLAPKDYVEQLNCYAWLLRANDKPVNKAQIIGILRDWSKMEASRTDDYPKKQVVVAPVELWESERTEKFLLDRLMAHLEAKNSLPLCTPEERWAKPDQYAVMKQGNKRAVKLHDAEVNALNHIALLGSGHYVEKRPGVNQRCSYYCVISDKCQQFKNLKGETNELG